MIRTSAAIATVAILLSLTLHVVGLSITYRASPDPSPGSTPTEVIALGNSFEDVAEPLSVPVQPERAPIPEPPVESQPELDSMDLATSDARVASDNPQAVASPDTGSTQTVRPQTTGPAQPEAAGTPELTTVTPVAGPENSVTDAQMRPPVGSDAATEVPNGEPDGDTVIAAVVPAAPARTPPAALAPEPPVAPVPSALPVTPPEAEASDPDAALSTIEPIPENADSAVAEDDAATSELAVATSLRPQLPSQRPSPAPAGLPDVTQSRAETRLAPSQLIESPLMAYQRDGTNMFAGRSGGSQSGRMGAVNSRGQGNADSTNYAGEILMHLNRVPPVPVSARGWARVFFQINPDGSLAWVEIIDGSGSPELDRAAKDQVRNAVPFPPPPGGKSRKLNFYYRIE